MELTDKDVKLSDESIFTKTTRTVLESMKNGESAFSILAFNLNKYSQHNMNKFLSDPFFLFAMINPRFSCLMSQLVTIIDHLYS